MLASGKIELAKQLEREYEFAGKASCATDGLCALDCPVAINTGDLIKQLRRESTTLTQQTMANKLAKNFGLAETAVDLSIGAGAVAGSVIGNSAMKAITQGLSKIMPGFPQWQEHLVEDWDSIDKQLIASLEDAVYVYWPTCMSRMMGGTTQDLLTVCDRAETPVHIPKGAEGKCCGQAFASKGFLEAAVAKQAELVDELWEWSQQGAKPVVLDLGSCTAFLKNGLHDLDQVRKDRIRKMQILDSVELAVALLPKLTIDRTEEPIAIHSVCSNHKSGIDAPMQVLANACSSNVVQPLEGKCCGMGGDRGFELPGLIKAAGAAVGPNMEVGGCGEGFTNARSCAISLTTSSGKPWHSVFRLLEERTRPNS